MSGTQVSGAVLALCWVLHQLATPGVTLACDDRLLKAHNDLAMDTADFMFFSGF